MLLSVADPTSITGPAGKAVRLESENLHVDVLPVNGGRVASIRCRHTGTEFLLPGSRYGAVARFGNDAAFEESDCAGIDECLPTVSPSYSESKFGSAPDHGDLWRQAWHVVERSSTHVNLAVTCFSNPLAFRRSLHVHASHVHLDYEIGNPSRFPVPFLYACHPLFAVEPGDRVILPREIGTVRFHYSYRDRLSNPGRRIEWPIPASHSGNIRFDVVGNVADGTAEMLYVENIGSGVCALYRAHRGQAVVMRFDSTVLPHLGLWLCNGGWPDNPHDRKQHAVAMEPTVAPHGALAGAMASGSAPVLNSGATFRFWIRLEILGCNRPCSQEEVKRCLHT